MSPPTQFRAFLAALVLGVVSGGPLAVAQPAGPPPVEADELPPLPEEPRPPPPGWSDWTRVNALTGSSSVQSSSQYEHSVPSSNVYRRSGGDDWAEVRMRLELDPEFADNPRTRVWRVVEARGEGGTYEEQRAQSTFSLNVSRSEGSFAGSLSLRTRPGLSLNLETGKWTFMTLAETATAWSVRTQGRVVETSITNPRDETIVSERSVTRAENAWIEDAAPRRVGGLSGQTDVDLSFAPETVAGLPGRQTGSRTGRVHFWPEWDDVEVIVEIPDYETWRPRGDLNDPDTPGPKPLKILARLQAKPRKDGQPATTALPEVLRFRFELERTSREPGVCLNWPLAAGKGRPPADPDFDLRFAADEGAGAVQLSPKRQKAGVRPVRADGGPPSASVVVQSYDFGGHAELAVIAELADGRKIRGELRNGPDGAKTVIRLPDRAAGSLIARSWARDKGVLGKSDRVDDETSELGLKGADGDGFCLYEEYRGFRVDRRFRSLDPEEKDFFIANEIGAPAKPGIALFTRLSGLRVHHQVVIGEEFDANRSRQMNRNHHAAPQRVAQHGIYLFTAPDVDGGLTGVDHPKGKRTRPATCLGVAIQPRDKRDSTLTKAFRVPASQAPYVYDRAIAHELFHSIGVDHHGEGDGKALLHFVFGDDPVNGYGRDRLVWSDTETDVTLLGERDRRSLFAEIAAGMRKVREYTWKAMHGGATPSPAPRPPISLDPKGTLEAWTKRIRELSEDERKLKDLNDFVGSLSYWFGDKGGQCSGDDQCVMRYYFADGFQAGTSKDTYFLIETDPEPAGLSLCENTQGTGVNRKGRTPEARFGNSAVGAGGCRHAFCVNDAIPP